MCGRARRGVQVAIGSSPTGARSRLTHRGGAGSRLATQASWRLINSASFLAVVCLNQVQRSPSLVGRGPTATERPIRGGHPAWPGGVQDLLACHHRQRRPQSTRLQRGFEFHGRTITGPRSPCPVLTPQIWSQLIVEGRRKRGIRCMGVPA